MKRTEIIKLLCVFCLISLCACTTTQQVAPSQGPTWQEQYDLGIRYLSEGNYQEAIIAFTAAIEIDPKRSPAYIGLADAFIGLGDYEGAILAIEQGKAECGELEEFVSWLENHPRGEQDTDGATSEKAPEEIPDEITVLVKQSYHLIPMELQHTVQDESTHYITFEYDSQGYMIHSEGWYYGKDDAREWNWILTSKNDWTYDDNTQTWTEYSEQRYAGSWSAEVQHNRGTGSSYAGEAHGATSITCDPYPEGQPTVVTNSKYGRYDDEPGSHIDWYTANYTYDDAGNVVLIESYSIDGQLLGTCELEYEVIKLDKS